MRARGNDIMHSAVHARTTATCIGGRAALIDYRGWYLIGGKVYHCPAVV